MLAAAGGLAAGFAAVAVGALAAWGAGSLSPSLKAASMTSFASPWRAVRALLGLALGSAAAKDATKAAATALAVVLLILLLRQVAGYPIRGERPLLAAGSSREAYGLTANDPVPLQDLAVMCAAAFAIAWLFAWPYVLPWYDSLGWPLLALVAWSELDWLLLARTSALALGYVAATGSALPGGLGWLQTVVREGLAPVVLLVCLVLLIRAVLPAQAGQAMRS